MKKITSIALSSALLLGAVVSTSNADTISSANFIQISGSDRISTSIELSKHSYPATSSSVVIASGELFPDALAGGTLSAVVDGPLLLTKKDNLPSNVKAELDRLKPKSIYILGGKNTISSNVEKQIKDTFDNVYRIDGTDRYETSIKIAEKVRSMAKDSKKTVFVNGINFADALSAGALGAKLKAPLILTNGKNLPSSVEKVADKNDKANNIIVGGQNSVNISDLMAERVSGADRYETSANLANKYFAKAENVALASGQDYPDGLSSISLYKKYQMPILLTEKVKLPASISKYMKDNESKLAVVVGGNNSISDNVRVEVKKIVEANKFKWAKPEFVDKLEASEKPQSIRIKLTQSYDQDGLIEIYKLDKDGKLPKEATIKGGFRKNNAVGQIVTFPESYILKKGEKLVARVISHDKLKFSDYTDIVTVSEDIPSAERIISMLRNISVNMTESDTNNDQRIINAINDKIKSMGLDSNYDVSVGSTVYDKSSVSNGKLTGKVEVTAKHKTKPSDTKTDKVDFIVNIVTNDVNNGTLTLAEKNPPEGANGNIISGNEREVNFIATFGKNGVPSESDLKNAKIAAKFNNTNDDFIKLPEKLTYTSEGNFIKYSGSFTVKESHPVGDVNITISTGANNSKTATAKITVVKNVLKKLETKANDSSADASEFVLKELNKDDTIIVKPIYVVAQNVEDNKLTATVESVTPVNGDSTSFDISKVNTTVAKDGNDKYKLTIKDTNVDKSHKIKIKLVYNDGSESKEKVIEFTYTSSVKPTTDKDAEPKTPPTDGNASTTPAKPSTGETTTPTPKP